MSTARPDPLSSRSPPQVEISIGRTTRSRAGGTTSRRGRSAALIFFLALVPAGSLASIGAHPRLSPEAPVRGEISGRAPLQETDGPEELFKRQCVACHGEEGKGDGPAAIALKPRPADLTDPELIGELSDEELIEVLTNGRGSMPSFGSLLEAEEIRSLVHYVRELSGTEGKP